MKLLLSFLLLLPLSSFSQIDFEKIFKDNKVTGSITIYDPVTDLWIYSNEADSKVATLPASTFKIINSLIALETGVVKNENELIKWVGINAVDTVHYGYRPDIYKDMNLAEALAKSAVWVHLELAKKIGREKYKHYLTLCKYGNLDFSEPGIDFWNFGPFAISPEQEINFIKDLYEEKLPFSKRNIAIVKKIMLTETGSAYEIHAKTGMAIVSQESLGWWIGYVENKGQVYYFATRIRKETVLFTSEFTSARKEITKTVLRQLNMIE
jgi:beta-lactamase class D